MTLLFQDNSPKERPRIHVLVVGVSAYPNLPAASTPPPPGGWPTGVPTLGLVQLESAALSAHALARWLIDYRPLLALPLGSVRALLSPTGGELKVQPVMSSIETGTLLNMWRAVTEWRKDAAEHSDNVTLFYFAGHGVQRRRNDHVLLLHDFGNAERPLLSSAITFEDLSIGMRPSATRPRMALNQISLVDACRVEPKVFEACEDFATSALWDHEEEQRRGSPNFPDLNEPTFFAAAPGRPAYAIKEGRSVFCEALLRCLRGGASVHSDTMRIDEPLPWRVTIHSLKSGLDDSVREINKATGTNQVVVCDRLGTNFDLCEFPVPPPVEVEFNLNPPAARLCTELALRTEGGVLVASVQAPISPHPYLASVPAGIYQLSGNVLPPRFLAGLPRFVLAKPPRLPLKIRSE